MPIESGRGRRPASRLGVWHVIGALAASAAVGGLLAYNFSQHRDANVELAKDFDRLSDELLRECAHS